MTIERGSIFDAITAHQLELALFRQRGRPNNDPQPGYWKIRLVKGGPYVPACIRRVQTTHEPGRPDNIMERSPFIAAFILGAPADLAEVWSRRGHEITKQQHDHLVAVARWARRNQPDEPIAEPSHRIDWNRTPVRF